MLGVVVGVCRHASYWRFVMYSGLSEEIWDLVAMGWLKQHIMDLSCWLILAYFFLLARLLSV